MKASVKANVNIALIKYWGKRDEALKLPQTSSLSFTVDNFYTQTEVSYDKDLDRDIFYLEDLLVEGHEYERVSRYMDVVRTRYQIPFFAVIRSYNHVPKAAGLASSSSAFAALAYAATKAFGLQLSKKELSKLARLGSGSAARSVDSGFLIWEKGISHDTSYAKQFATWDDFRMVVCLVSQDEKSIGSGIAMKKTMAHKDYHLWISKVEKDLVDIKKALLKKDMNAVGAIAESNALFMHEMILKVGINYFSPKTYDILNLVKKLRNDIPVYATMDAGPNVKIMTTKAYIKPLIEKLDGVVDYVICKSGRGLEVLYED